MAYVEKDGTWRWVAAATPTRGPSSPIPIAGSAAAPGAGAAQDSQAARTKKRTAAVAFPFSASSNTPAENATSVTNRTKVEKTDVPADPRCDRPADSAKPPGSLTNTMCAEEKELVCLPRMNFYRPRTDPVRGYPRHPRYCRLLEVLRNLLLIDLCNLIYAFVRPPSADEIMWLVDFQPSDEDDHWKLEPRRSVPFPGLRKQFQNILHSRVFQMDAVVHQPIFMDVFGRPVMEFCVTDFETIAMWEAIYDKLSLFARKSIAAEYPTIDPDAIKHRPPYRSLPIKLADFRPASQLPSQPQAIIFRFCWPRTPAAKNPHGEAQAPPNPEDLSQPHPLLPALAARARTNKPSPDYRDRLPNDPGSRATPQGTREWEQEESFNTTSPSGTIKVSPHSLGFGSRVSLLFQIRDISFNPPKQTHEELEMISVSINVSLLNVWLYDAPKLPQPRPPHPVVP